MSCFSCIRGRWLTNKLLLFQGPNQQQYNQFECHLAVPLRPSGGIVSIAAFFLVRIIKQRIIRRYDDANMSLSLWLKIAGNQLLDELMHSEEILQTWLRILFALNLDLADNFYRRTGRCVWCGVVGVFLFNHPFRTVLFCSLTPHRTSNDIQYSGNVTFIAFYCILHI